MSLTEPFTGIGRQTPPSFRDRNSAGERVWHLRGKTGEHEPVREIPIRHFPFRIGRQGNVDVLLHFPTISGTHAEIVEDNGTLILHDAQSTNGTYVNGTPLIGPIVLREGDLVQFADIGFHIGCKSLQCRDTVALGSLRRAGGQINIDQLLDGKLLTPHFQPVLDYRDNRVIGYEALARSAQPGLESPAAMFRIAEQVRLESELSRTLRYRAIETGRCIAADLQVFVNTHPSETADEEFLLSLRKLREDFPTQDITIEVHEMTAENTSAMRMLRDQLNSLNMRLAYDDFGAGKARLLELIDVQPDYLKFDRSLLRNIHLSTVAHRETVRSLVNIAKQLGVITLAEGIESRDEDLVCRGLGFDLGQGFFYGRPAAPDAWR